MVKHAINYDFFLLADGVMRGAALADRVRAAKISTELMRLLLEGGAVLLLPQGVLLFLRGSRLSSRCDSESLTACGGVGVGTD